MINIFYNLPTNIQASIYSFDTTFRDKYDNSMNEMMKLMDEPIYCIPDEYYCCYYCYRNQWYIRRTQIEGDRKKTYKQEITQIKQEIIYENKLIDDDGFVKVVNKKIKAKKARDLNTRLLKLVSN